MADTIAERLKALGYSLPQVNAPAANYVPYKQAGHLLAISGQVPKTDGKMVYVGRAGEQVSTDDARAAAELCALNLLAQLNAALEGDLSRLEGCLRLRGFVNAAPDFGPVPAIIDAASDLIVAVLGEPGRHTRTAIGTSPLPHGCTVEIDADFILKA